MSAVDNLLSQYMCTAMQRKLSLDPSQVFPAIAPDYDPSWKGDVIIEVIAGAAAPYGAGQGAQEGGADLRKQTFTLVVYYRCKLDEYGRSTQLLTEANRGLFDLFTTIRSLFKLTCFPTSATPAGSDDFLLFEPMKWEGESPTTWEDPERYVARRDMTLGAVYGVRLPTQVTLEFLDYT